MAVDVPSARGPAGESSDIARLPLSLTKLMCYDGLGLDDALVLGEVAVPFLPILADMYRPACPEYLLSTAVHGRLSKVVSGTSWWSVRSYITALTVTNASPP